MTTGQNSPAAAGGRYVVGVGVCVCAPLSAERCPPR